MGLQNERRGRDIGPRLDAAANDMSTSLPLQERIMPARHKIAPSQRVVADVGRRLAVRRPRTTSATRPATSARDLLAGGQ
jgi:hypothetical protein